MKDDRIYLDHILECLKWIAEFALPGRAFFLSDRKTQSAILRELQTLAESTQRLSPALRDAEPGVPWAAIAGFRNILTHNYLGLDLERIWEVVERDLPALRVTILAMRSRLP